MGSDVLTPPAEKIRGAGPGAGLGRPCSVIVMNDDHNTFEGVARALAAGLSPLLVVVGHEPDRVREALAGVPARFVENPDWAEGQGSSVAAGAAAVPPGIEGAVVLLADMPAVTADMIRALANEYNDVRAER